MNATGNSGRYKLRRAHASFPVALLADLTPCGRSVRRAARGGFLSGCGMLHSRTPKLAHSSVREKRRHASVAVSRIIHEMPEKSSNFPMKWPHPSFLSCPGRGWSWIDLSFASRDSANSGVQAPIRTSARSHSYLAARSASPGAPSTQGWPLLTNPLCPVVSPGHRALLKAGRRGFPPALPSRLFGNTLTRHRIAQKAPESPWLSHFLRDLEDAPPESGALNQSRPTRGFIPLLAPLRA